MSFAADIFNPKLVPVAPVGEILTRLFVKKAMVSVPYIGNPGAGENVSTPNVPIIYQSKRKTGQIAQRRTDTTAGKAVTRRINGDVRIFLTAQRLPQPVGNDVGHQSVPLSLQQHTVPDPSQGGLPADE